MITVIFENLYFTG